MRTGGRSASVRGSAARRSRICPFCRNGSAQKVSSFPARSFPAHSGDRQGSGGRFRRPTFEHIQKLLNPLPQRGCSLQTVSPCTQSIGNEVFDAPGQIRHFVAEQKHFLLRGTLHHGRPAEAIARKWFWRWKTSPKLHPAGWAAPLSHGQKYASTRDRLSIGLSFTDGPTIRTTSMRFPMPGLANLQGLERFARSRGDLLFQ